MGPPPTILLLRKLGKYSFVWYNLDRFFYRFVTIHACDRRTDGQFSSLYRVCITCSAVKIRTQNQKQTYKQAHKAHHRQLAIKGYVSATRLKWLAAFAANSEHELFSLATLVERQDFCRGMLATYLCKNLAVRPSIRDWISKKIIITLAVFNNSRGASTKYFH